MNRLTHFLAGTAAASCLPGTVPAAVAGNPFYLVAGGVIGVLPNLLDSIAARGARPCDIAVVPDPLAFKPGANPSAQPRLIAAGVAAAAGRAVDSGKRVRVRLARIPTGKRHCYPYEVHFDVSQRRVRVRVEGRARAEAAQATPQLHLDHLARIRIGSGSDAVVDMVPLAGGAVMPCPMPSRRQWSHSLAAGALLTVLTAALAGGLAGWVAASAWTLHLVLDRLDYMGCNIGFPLTRRRAGGLGVSYGQEPVWNAVVCWVSLCLTGLNLFLHTPGAGLPATSLPLVLGIGLGPPALAYLLRRHRLPPVGRDSTSGRAAARPAAQQ